MSQDDEPFSGERSRRSLATALVALLAGGLLIAIACSGHIARSAPVLAITSIEPSDIFDDRGSEMWLVTLSVSNSETLPPIAENYLYINDGKNAIEARTGSHWISVDGKMDFHGLAPGNACQKMFLMPQATDLCRVPLKFTGAHLIKGRAAWLAEHLPQSIRYHISYKFWRWVGFADYRASSNWREITLELPITNGQFRLPEQQTHFSSDTREDR